MTDLIVYLVPMTQTQLPIELGDDEESDRLPSHMLERIGLRFLSVNR